MRSHRGSWVDAGSLGGSEERGTQGLFKRRESCAGAANTKLGHVGANKLGLFNLDEHGDSAVLMPVELYPLRRKDVLRIGSRFDFEDHRILVLVDEVDLKGVPYDSAFSCVRDLGETKEIRFERLVSRNGIGGRDRGLAY